MIDLFTIKGVRAAHPCVFSMILVLMILMTAFGMHLVSDECMDGFSRRQSHTVSPFCNRFLHLQVIAVQLGLDSQLDALSATGEPPP